ncbi:MAG: hypothetical protein EB060_04190 [Proteobacteria bacterium]|nr:hypothetical protein [Pseudomonadota bacterium]
MIRADNLNIQCLEMLKKIELSTDMRDNLEMHLSDIFLGKFKEIKMLQVSAEMAVKKLDNKIQTLIQSYTEGIVSKEIYLKLYNQFALERLDWNKKHYIANTAHQQFNSKLMSIIDFASNAKSSYQDTQDHLERMKILYMVCDNIVLKNRTLEFSYRPPLNILATKGKKTWKNIVTEMREKYFEEIILFSTKTEAITHYDLIYNHKSESNSSVPQPTMFNSPQYRNKNL